jgi:cysteine desulfuration protein SufE
VRRDGAAGLVLTFAGDSDAHIVRGLIAILFAIFSGQSARHILETDALGAVRAHGIAGTSHPQRSHGFRSMVKRIRADAREALTAATV